MECSTSRIQERAQHVENYRYGTIYVRKITKDHIEKDIQQVLNDVSNASLPCFCSLNWHLFRL